MRKMITRKMVTSKIYGFKLDMKNGNPEVVKVEPITIAGKVNDIDGLKALKNAYGKTEPLMVEKIEQFEAMYEISVNDFLKYAKKVEVKEGKVEEKEEVKEGKVEELKEEEKEDKKEIPFKPNTKSNTTKIGVKPATK